MKKLLMTLLLTLFTCVFSTIGIFKAEATNWIQAYEDDRFTCYFDSDSFNYDQDTNIVKCWAKIDEKKSKQSMVSYNLFNYNDQTYAVKSSLLYVDGQSVDSVTDTLLEYKPIPPDTIIYGIYSKLEFIKSLTDKGVEWEFNNEYLPEPSELDSEFWVESEATPGQIYDKITYRFDEKNNIEYFWVKETKTYGEDVFHTLSYIKVNFNNNKVAIVAVRDISNGKPSRDIDHKLLLWLSPEDLNSGFSSPIYTDLLTEMLSFNCIKLYD